MFSPEYNTIIQCTPKLRTAVKGHLTVLSGRLLENYLVDSEKESDLRNEFHSESKRAAWLVELVLDKVKLNPASYHTFVKVLEEDKDAFMDILELLSTTYRSLTGGV